MSGNIEKISILSLLSIKCRPRKEPFLSTESIKHEAGTKEIDLSSSRESRKGILTSSKRDQSASFLL